MNMRIIVCSVWRVGLRDMLSQVCCHSVTMCHARVRALREAVLMDMV
jgi:hypothetical protein